VTGDPDYPRVKIMIRLGVKRMSNYGHRGTGGAFAAASTLLLLGVAVFFGGPVGVRAEEKSGAPTRTAAPPDVVQAMAGFDRAYIPALSLSNQGALEKTRKAALLLMRAWAKLKADYRGYSGDDRWQTAFERVDEILAEAMDRVEKPDLPGFHEALEGVREIFTGLRGEYSIGYYIDYLNLYHETMEKIAGLGKVDSPEKLGEDKIKAIASLAPEAIRRWKDLAGAPFDPKAYQFDAAKTGDLRNAVAAIGESVNRLETALQSRDRGAIAAASQDLRPPYVKTFLMFGDFSGLR
jgi:hypothetical protein